MKSKSIFAIITIWLILILAIAGIGYIALHNGLKAIDFTLNLFVLSFSFLAILVCCSLLFWNKTAKEQNKRLTTLYLTPYIWLVIIMVLSLVAVPFMNTGDKIDPQNVTNFYTAFIALCTTFVVGFQIYNSIDLNKKIEELNSKNSELEKKWSERQQILEEESKARRNELIEEINNAKKTITRNNYFNAYIMASNRFTLAFSNRYLEDKRLCWNSLRSYFLALKYAAEGGHDFMDALSAIIPKIKKCIKELSDRKNSETFHRINLYKDKFIREINASIDDISNILGDSDISGNTITRFENLQHEWNQFLSIFDIDF